MSAADPIALLASTTAPASGAGAATTGLDRYKGVFGVIGVTQVSVGGNGTLDVYVQASPDGGATWRDVAAQRFTAVGARMFQLSQVASPGTSTLAASDAALASGSEVQGPFGDRLRVKYVVTLNADTGAFVFSVSAVPSAGV